MSEEEKKPDSAMEEVNGDESADAESSNPTSSERAERNSRRADEDREAKRRSRRSTRPSKSPVPGAFSGSSDDDSLRADRMSRRAQEEREAKRKGRSSTRKSTRPGAYRDEDPGSERRRREDGPTSGADRLSRRSREEQEAKRRAKGSSRSSSPLAGAQSLDGSSRSSDHEAKRRSKRSTRSTRPGAESVDDAHSKRKSRRPTRATQPGVESVHGVGENARARAESRKQGRFSRSSRSTSSVDSDDGNIMSPAEIRDQRIKLWARKDRRSNDDQMAKQRAKGISVRAGPDVQAVGGDDIQDGDQTAEGLPTALHIEAQAVEGDGDLMEKQVQERVQNILQGQQEAGMPLASTGNQVEGQAKPVRYGYKKRNIVIIGVVILAMIGGVVGFLLSQSSDSEPTTAQDTTSSPTAATDSPTTPPPTSLPTSAPTELIKYDPPREEDCATIQRKEAVEGQDELLENSFDVPIDVSLTEEQDVDSWLGEFMVGMEEYLVPSLVGCSDVTRRLLEANDEVSMRGSRRLENIRNVIANAIASGVYQIDQLCEADAQQPCYRIVLNLRLFLKGEERIFSLITIITDVLSSNGDPLIDQLDLPSQFSNVLVVGVTNLNPTRAPSSAPSGVPSVSPTFGPSSSPSTSPPTETPSVNPTRAPVVGPTTEEPTNAPSSLPSPGPTPSPTPAPTPNPTFAPFPGATPPPTPEPTPAPTPDPTFVPFPGPSPPPTPEPTPSPTSSPTSGPTSEPTPAPSSQPTKNPSPQPTFARQPAGSSCTFDTQCTSGFCDSTISISNICKSDTGGECSDDYHCVIGICYLGQICDVPVDVGSQCSKDTDCEEGLVCDGSICKASFGGQCSADDHCFQGICYLEQICDDPVDVGDMCFKGTDCEVGLICDGSICKASFGGQCSDDDHCFDGICYLEQICDDPVDVGSQCFKDTDCEAGLICDGSICKASFGGQCSDDDHCFDGICYLEQICDDPVDLGSQCFKATDCQSGICSGNICKASFGGQCSDDDHCFDGICYLEQICDDPMDLGSQCFKATDCQSGICSGNICKADIGESCFSNNDDCVMGICYLGVSCQYPQTFGGFCSNNNDCAEDLGCFSNACHYGDGHSCTGNYQCIPFPSTCLSWNQCGTKLGSGASCSQSNDCFSGMCTNNLFQQGMVCL